MALTPETTREYFRAGNYMTAAWRGDPDHWQTHAAMGLVGRTDRALAGLEAFSEPEARFYAAVIHWIAGDEPAAVKGLAAIETDHAKRLLALIRKPEIQVLSQMTWLRHSPHDLISAIRDDAKFKVRNVSFHPPDFPNTPYADVRTWYDREDPPDFYVTSMLEWHAKPPNLQDLPCPVFGHTSDIDVHVQAVYPWFHVFDELLTTGAEWYDLRRMVRSPVSVFPRVYGIADNLPAVPDAGRNRDIDVFISGTSLHPYHPDKALLYHQVIGMTGVNLKIINGFVLPAEYYALLGRSRVVFTYYRRDEAPLTRALEALAMGCAVVMQRGNMLGLYVGEENGVFYYDVDKDNLVSAIKGVLADWPAVAPRARQGAIETRREFALKRLASQYFRFLTFLAARPRGPRRRQSPEKLDQRRLILWKGLLPAPAPMLQRIREESIARWQDRPGLNASPRLINHIARELVLEYASLDTGFHQMTSSVACEQLMNRILEIYSAGIARFPRSLVLRFNMLRTALLFGQPHDVVRALELGHDTLARPPSHWHVDVMEDVLPWDFCETYFNYRAYFDAIVRHLATAQPVSEDLKRLIRASIAFYLGHYAPDIACHRMAHTLDPDFPFYAFGYARRLIRQGRREDYREAGDLLTRLVMTSVVAFEAYELLKWMQGQNLYTSPQEAELRRRIEQARKTSSLVERPPYALPLKPACWTGAGSDANGNLRSDELRSGTGDRTVAPTERVERHEQHTHEHLGA